MEADSERTETLGRWRILARLGEGDFGDVFECTDGETVAALKRVPLSTRSAVVRLGVEQEALRLLDHPGIPSLLDSGEDDQFAFFVMTLAPGDTVLKTVDGWATVGRVHGSIEAVKVIRNFLEIVTAVHEAGLVHRDIKDANVLMDGERVTLIDFGFCKQTGISDIRDSDSFWRAGAARFSPLSKLDNPSLAAPSHDVYAAGVLAYRLVTGLYPWSVSAASDVGALKQMIRDRTLVFPHEINSLIPIPLSRFIAGLLAKEDASRPTAAAALLQANELLSELLSGRHEATWKGALIARPHVVRDQIHGDVRLTDMEYRVLNTREMQRLRWIKQLGLTNLVYPGAEHSRLSHSIGTVDCVERVLSAIEEESGTRFDADTRHIARLHALTHDVSHIASGHTIEDELGFFPRHDKNVGRFDRLIASEDSELGKLLRSSDIGREVMRLLDPRTQQQDRGIVDELVSGVLGADVLDYVDRDAFNCGLDHRVDSAIYRQIKINSRERPDSVVYSYEAGKYGVRVDRHYAVESLLAERYALFLKVYTHSAKIAADSVLSKALTMRRKSVRESDFEWLGDDSLISWLEASPRLPQAQALGRRLRKRQLPRGVYRARVLAPDSLDHRSYQDTQSRLEEDGWLTPAGRAKFESEVARVSRIPSDRLFFYLPASAPGYKRTEMWAAAASGGHPQRSESREGIELSRRHLALWQAWVFVADASDEERARVAEAAEGVFHRPNLVDRYRQSLFGDIE